MSNHSEDITTSDNDTNISDGESNESEVSSLSDTDEEEANLEDEELIEEEEDIPANQEIIITGKDRITRPFMTKYELVRIIATRKQQLSLCAKPMIKVDGDLTIDEIIKEEIKHKMIPYKIKRPIDGNRVEIWKFEELSIDHLNILELF